MTLSLQCTAANPQSHGRSILIFKAIGHLTSHHREAVAIAAASAAPAPLEENLLVQAIGAY